MLPEIRVLLFFFKLLRNRLSTQRNTWSSLAIVFTNPERRDSPICDDDAGVHGHGLRFLLFQVFIMRIATDLYELLLPRNGCRILNL